MALPPEAEFPSIRTAVLEQEMIPLLQSALLDGGRHSISALSTARVFYLPNHSCSLRYEAEIVDEATGAKLTWPLNARLYHGASEARRHRDALLPLAEKVRDRNEVRCFTSLVSPLGPLNMIVEVFPIDAELPTLVDLTDVTVVTPLLAKALGANANEVAKDCKVQVGHYGRRHRCVLRYEIGRLSSLDSIDGPIRLYGKVTNDPRKVVSPRLIEALRQGGLGGPAYAVPRCVGSYPSLGLSLLEDMPGRTMKHPLRDHLRGRASRKSLELSVEWGIETAAGLLAALHTCGVTAGQTRSLATEVAALRHDIESIRRWLPDLGELLHDRLLQAHATLKSSPALDPVLCHGDFRYSQLLFNRETCTLLDFDTLCLAEPVLDVGHFLSYLELEALKPSVQSSDDALRLTNDLCSLFVDAYLAAVEGKFDGSLLRSRVTGYRDLSLVRMAVHSWQKMKMSRLSQVLAHLAS
jgi:hypothetical protein